MSRENIHKKTISNIKKILSKSGQLGGSFYFVSNGTGTDTVIVVNLVKKAADAKRSVREGKGFRQEIKGSKFASGSVSGTGKKLTFHIELGTAPATLMKTAFTKLATADTNLALLRKAKYQKGEEIEEAEDTSDVKESEITLSAKEQNDLNAVMADGEAISVSNQAILDAMAEEELEDLQKEVGNSAAAIAALEAAFDGTEEKALTLQKARLALASKLGEGADSFKGTTLPPAMKESFNAAIGESLTPMFQKYQELSNLLTELIDEHEDIVKDGNETVNKEELERLKELVKQEEQCTNGIDAYEKAIDRALAIMKMQ